MRKIILFSVLILFQGSFLYAMKDCSELEANYNTLKDQVAHSMDEWRIMDNSDPNKALHGKALSDMLTKGVKLENDYNDCINSIKNVNSLIETYFDLGDEYFSQKKWDKAVEQYKKVTDLDPESYKANYNIGSAFLNQWSLKDALEYYEHARYFARGKSQMSEAKTALDHAEKLLKEEEKVQSAVSDDTFSHLQYYLRVLNVPEAWRKVKDPKEVVVAVVDDGININHPDLTDHIWTENSSTYGSSKIKDFVGDNLPDNLPTGEHGTMIAGIIGATADNKKWIAGIAKNVKIMPLRVFDFKGNAREESIINAMYYAIDHHANIINLSLGQSQFAYSTKYDEVMKKAYENGVVVVVAAGNGDVLSYANNGVNTTVNPLSPVCNNTGKKKYSLWVEALDQKWVRARWSNYGDCIAFSAPGENIFSTSVSIFNKTSWVDYDTASGTSFSAPMIAGVIALGYNKYGYVSPDTIYMSLNESLKINDVGNYVVNVGKYLDVLESKAELIKKEQAAFQKNGKNIAPVVSQKTGTWSAQKKSIVGGDSLSDGDFLLQSWLINGALFASGYHLGDMVMREEVVALALKILNIYLPDHYNCRGMYADVSATKPNTWACQIVEIATEKWLVSVQGANFRPEEKLTLIETLSILMKAGNIHIDQYSGGEFDPGQTNVIGTAFRSGIIDASYNISPSTKTLRSQLFHIARKVFLLQK